MELNNGTAGQVSPNTSTPVAAAPSAAGTNQPLSGEESQMAEMILSDLAKKLMSPETADVSLQESIGKRLSDFAEDTRTPEERQFDKDFPAAKSHEIQWPHTEEATTPAYNAVRNEVNGRFIDAGMTADTASYIIKEADAFGYRSERWSAEEFTLYARSEMAKLECLFGTQTAAKIETARKLIQTIEAKRPGLVDLLERTGLGSNSGVILQSVNHAERLAYRNGLKK
jgi:hypothetical protein